MRPLPASTSPACSSRTTAAASGRRSHGLPVTWLEDAGPVQAAVGTGERDRRPIAERLTTAGIEPVAVVHPAAHVSASARIREGCVVGPAAVVGAATELGRHVVVGRGALVGHHVVVGDFATLNPGANVGGNTTIGSGALVAIGAVVRDHVRVGASALVGAGAVVVGDVPDGVEVRGLPARPVERRDPPGGVGEDAAARPARAAAPRRSGTCRSRAVPRRSRRPRLSSSSAASARSPCTVGAPRVRPGVGERREPVGGGRSTREMAADKRCETTGIGVELRHQARGGGQMLPFARTASPCSRASSAAAKRCIAAATGSTRSGPARSTWARRRRAASSASTK